MSILTSHMMVTKNPQNVHRKCFWTILVTFIFDVKIDVNMCEPHYVNLFFLWTSSIVHVFDFLTFDIFLTNCHLFDILTSFNLNHLSPSQGYFFTTTKLLTHSVGSLTGSRTSISTSLLTSSWNASCRWRGTFRGLCLAGVESGLSLSL